MLAVMPGVVGDILNPYHSEWLTDIILIVYFVLNGFGAADIFKVWKSGALLDDEDPSTDPNYDRIAKQEKQSLLLLEADGASATANANAFKAAAVQKQAPPVVVPSALARSLTCSQGGGGGLSSLLKRERSGRVAVSANRGTVAGRASKSMFWQAPSAIMKPSVSTAAPPASNSSSN